jgi:hypothetical protein
MVLFHVTLQTNPVPSLPQAAVKTPRVRVDTQPTFCNGSMALNTDGVCPVIMAAGTGVNEISLGLGIKGFIPETEGGATRFRIRKPEVRRSGVI